MKKKRINRKKSVWKNEKKIKVTRKKNYIKKKKTKKKTLNWLKKKTNPITIVKKREKKIKQT